MMQIQEVLVFTRLPQVILMQAVQGPHLEDPVQLYKLCDRRRASPPGVFRFPLDLELCSFRGEGPLEVILQTRKLQSGKISDLPKCIHNFKRRPSLLS